MKSPLVNKHKYYNYEFFARWAKLYDYEKYILWSMRKKAAEFLNLSTPKKILDVACGTGSQTYELAKLGHEVIGIDLSPQMLEQSRKKCDQKLKLSFLQQDATNLSFKNSTFDIATISLGLHDMPFDVDLQVLSEMKRVTKKDGLILIVDHMEPRKNPIARLFYPVIKRVETKDYVPFIERGLEVILIEVKLKIWRYSSYCGLIQMVLVKNSKRV